VLGLFDSGLGGLTVLRRLRASLPQHDMLFFADQANVPYGDRSTSDLQTLLRANIAFLDDARCDAIVMACNTSCAIAERFGWPASRALIVDLIDSAAITLERSRATEVGVIATSVTARSGAYGRKIRALVPGAQVTEIAAPALVPLIEAGGLDSGELRAAVKVACAALPRDIEAILYACTHFPLIDERFAEALPPNVVRIDPARVHAERTAELVARHGFAGGRGSTRYVTNGDEAAFEASVERIMDSVTAL